LKRSPPAEFPVAVGAHASTTAIVYPAGRAERPDAALIVAHGAGSGQRSPFIVHFAEALSALGIDVVTFNFLYTEQRRHVPDRAPALEECYRAVIAEVRDRLPAARKALFIGGKSMGGRIATQVAAADPALPIAGLVALGYPLHPPGRPQQLRDAHLPSIKRPMLVVQGSRDTFGTPAELEPVLDTLVPRPTLFVVDGGDHSFRRSRGGADAQAAIDDDVRRTVAEWISAIRANAR
jgi:predicted alpha/beta-hydrolase family hydrolase